MRTYVIKNQRPIPLGRQGENKATTILFNIASFFPGLSGAEYGLMHQRPGDPGPYWILEPDEGRPRDGFIHWLVSDADVAKVGNGTAQLIAYVGDQVYRTVVFTTVIAGSLGIAPTPPAAAQAWVDSVYAARDAANQSASDAAVYASNAAASASAAAASAASAAEHVLVAPVFTYYDSEADADAVELLDTTVKDIYDAYANGDVVIAVEDSVTFGYTKEYTAYTLEQCAKDTSDGTKYYIEFVGRRAFKANDADPRTDTVVRLSFTGAAATDYIGSCFSYSATDFDPSKLSLGVYSGDGKLYVYYDGARRGTGVSL